jgi:drug/metabolite transporter (DMT)-like permease
MIVVITAFTLVAFAANSLLCRMALGSGLIDPVSFTTLRLASGALTLVPLSWLFAQSEPRTGSGGSWASGFALFAYAGAFSLAYVSLNTGMGALILFGSVQVTMMGFALRSGEALNVAQGLGSLAAVAGLVYLVLPGLSAPDPLGALLMAVAGIAWGIYSIRGRGGAAPVRMTAGNFQRSAPFALLASLLAVGSIHMAPNGVLLALASGIVTSGMGYILWYKALRTLRTTQASVLQLLVPVIAAFGGVAFLSEEVSFRLLIGSALILGGVVVAVVRRVPAPPATAS